MKLFTYFITMIVLISTEYSCHKKEELLKVGTNVWPGYEPIYVAREIGKLDKNIKLIEFGSTSQVMRAYRKNLINGAGLTVDEVILLKSFGFSPKIVLVADVSNGADVLIVKPYIKSLKELKGKRIGVENTALGAFYLTRILEKAGLTDKDIKIVPLEINEHFNAFVKNKIDAVITFEPVKTRLIKVGGKVIFDSSMIPNEIVDVFVVEESYIKKNKNTVHNFVKNWFDGLNYLNKNPEKAYKIISAREGSTLEEIRKSYKGLVLPSKEENIKIMKNKLPKTILIITNIMKKKGLLEKSFNLNPEDMIDTRFLKDL